MFGKGLGRGGDGAECGVLRAGVWWFKCIFVEQLLRSWRNGIFGPGEDSELFNDSNIH